MERESNSRVKLDDVCGKQSKGLKKDRLFQNHYRTHSEEKYQCEECPSVWSGGPENIFNTKKQKTITLNLKAHRVTKHEGRLALKFMYHILINYGTHSHLSDPSKIGTHIHVSHFFATLGDKVSNNGR